LIKTKNRTFGFSGLEQVREELNSVQKENQRILRSRERERILSSDCGYKIIRWSKKRREDKEYNRVNSREVTLELEMNVFWVGERFCSMGTAGNKVLAQQNKYLQVLYRTSACPTNPGWLAFCAPWSRRMRVGGYKELRRTMFSRVEI
jgi:ABC-type Fe3+-citrate transport system substrate-binding protein